jgi:hypothetical protein
MPNGWGPSIIKASPPEVRWPDNPLLIRDFATPGEARKGMDITNYDKAEWHYEGSFPEDLDFFQAHIHTGMFLGWLIERGMISDRFRESSAEILQAFENREMTGSQVYEQACGCLSSDMLNEKGNDFAGDYYLRRGANFFNDFDGILGAGLPSCYHVEDTWENYELIRGRIDVRYGRWLEGGR